MKSPIELAKAATPVWMMEIFSYDAIEINPVRDTRWNDAEQGIRPFCKDRDNDTGCEPCARCGAFLVHLRPSERRRHRLFCGFCD